MPDDNIAPAEVTTEQKEPRLYGKTQQACKLIVEHGVDPKTALILTTGNENPNRATVARLREKSSKYALSRPAMVKMAHQAIKETLAMKPIVTADGKEIHPSHTNRLAAAAMVADRAEPIVRMNQNMNINVEISPVDLDKYR